MSYATPEEIREALAPYAADLTLPDGADFERLIARGERAVDQRLGPYAPDPITGRKLDPSELTPSQADALRRAVALAVGHLAMLDTSDDFGLDDLLPEQMHATAGRGLAAVIDAEIADLGLIARSGTVLTPVDESA